MTNTFWPNITAAALVLVGAGAVPASAAITIFGNAARLEAAGPPGFSFELGTVFQSSAAGQVTGLRFYMGPLEANDPGGAIIGKLWTGAGVLLDSATFVNPTQGWNEVSLLTPISLSPGVSYVVSANSNLTTLGVNHSANEFLFFGSSSFSNVPLTATAGTFTTSPGTFPTGIAPPVAGGSFYGRDIVFEPAQSAAVPEPASVGLWAAATAVVLSSSLRHRRKRIAAPCGAKSGRSLTRPGLERLEERIVLSFSFGSAFQIGSPRTEGGASIDTDASGHVYLSGHFQETVDLDPGPGTQALTTVEEPNDFYDGFVAKYSPGGELLWATQFDYSPSNVTVRSNDLYVFVSAPSASGLRGLAKLDAATGEIAWTTAVAGYGAGIAVDAAGSVYLASNASYSPSGFTVGATISKIDPATGAIVWTAATAYSGDLGADALEIAVSSSGSVYVTGAYSGTVDFDTGAGTFLLTSTPTASFNKEDAFLWKLDAATGEFEWAGSMGGNGSDFGTALAIDAANNVYLAGQWAGGQTTSQNDFDPGAGSLALPRYGSSDIFVEKFVPNAADGGRTLKASWAKSLGGSSVDGATEIALDAAGSIYLGGHFSSTADFDPSNKKSNLTSTGFLDAFICRLSASGAFMAAAKIGGGGNDSVGEIAIDGLGSVYLTGTFERTADFDPGRGTYNMTASSGSISYPDIYVARYVAPGSAAPASAPLSSGSTSPSTTDDALLLFLTEGLTPTSKRK